MRGRNLVPVATVTGARKGVLEFQKGPLAQLVEQLTFNQLVAGSTPARPTKIRHLRLVSKKCQNSRAKLLICA